MKNLIKKFIPAFLLDFYHFSLALIGAFLYRFSPRPRQGFGGQAKKLKIIGVTGTSGKSTVVELTSKIFEEAGYKVASLSSIRFKIAEKEWPNTLKMTMPGRFKLQKFLRGAVKAGCQYAVLEVTSEGIKQHRHRFIDFDVAVFTNLSPEHIEAHGSFENYKKAKAKLFQKTKKIHIVNLDDKNAKDFLKIESKEKWLYTMSGEPEITERENLFIVNCPFFSPTEQGINFRLQDTQFNLSLPGKFNAYNALAAISIGLSQGISLKVCKEALEKVKGIPGRMEGVISEPFKVIVDYAHTPVALEKVYQTVTGLKPKTYNLKPNLICVLGACGGGRDKWKRPVLGEIAAKYCQKVIVTNEDPYDENPMVIIEEVAKGAEKISVNQRLNQRKSAVQKILNRRKAIKKALEEAKEGDVVVITGKGSEPWICVEKGRKIPWDDRKIVKEELKHINKNLCAQSST